MEIKNGLFVAAAAVCATVFADVAPHARFEDGMLSRTRPSGWLLGELEKQKEGLTGHPEAMGYPYDSCLWAGTIPRKGKHGRDWWRYEQTAYYTDGLLRLGYALGDAGLVAKGSSGIDWTLAHAAPEGFLGHECMWNAEKYDLHKGCIMWPMVVFFRAMKARYEAAPDSRIPEALAKYYLLYGTNIVSLVRNVDSAEGMVWTYGIAGDRRLLDLAEQSWRCSKMDKDMPHHSFTPDVCTSDDAIYMHGVSYCEGLKVPMLLYAYTGETEYLDQALNAERKLVRDHLLPDGCPGATEEMRGNSVHWGHETCDVSDYTWSLGYFLQVTGDAQYADRIERCVFNAGFGSTTSDFKALQYFSNLNQFIATSDSNHNPCKYGEEYAQYRPSHRTECCAGNVTRFLPNYVSRMWMKDAGGNPVAALYGPCEVDFGNFRIREETRYPFDGKITFRFLMTEPVQSTFTYRIPGWCKDAKVKINGEAADCGEPGSFAAIRRMFRDGDEIELDFPMETVFEVLPRRHYVIKDYVNKWAGRIEGRTGSQGTVVRRGPLLFAYSIPADKTEDSVERRSVFKSWNMRPAAAFNYALAAREARTGIPARSLESGFCGGASSVSVSVPVKRIEWELVKGRFTPDIPENPKVSDDSVEWLELVPYGATTLRLAVFPDVSRAQKDEP